jgi:hypothetical protein
MWGPLALAGDLGPEQKRKREPEGNTEPPPAPVLVAADRSADRWLRTVPDKPGTFRTAGVGLSKEIDFVPFYRLPARRYAIYWDLLTPDESRQRAQASAVEQEKLKRLETATVAFVQPGQMQTEREFNLQGQSSSPVLNQGRYGRRGTKWFSFDVPVDPTHPMTLVVTYSNDERQRRTFDVLVEGRKVGEQSTERRSPEQDIRYFDVEYVLPAALIFGRQKVTVRFEATNESEIGAVFGIRMIRSDAPR